jgi:hypothetical protein
MGNIGFGFGLARTLPNGSYKLEHLEGGETCEHLELSNHTFK